VGIESIDDLTGAEPDDVANEIDGVSADRIRKWQADA